MSLRSNRFVSLAVCLTIAAASLQSTPAQARGSDLADASPAELVEFCTVLAQFAELSAERADEGMDKQAALDAFEAANSDHGVGPEAAEMTRAVIRSAYLRPSDETPSQYAERIQPKCLDWIESKLE